MFFGNVILGVWCSLILGHVIRNASQLMYKIYACLSGLLPTLFRPLQVVGGGIRAGRRPALQQPEQSRHFLARRSGLAEVICVMHQAEHDV